MVSGLPSPQHANILPPNSGKSNPNISYSSAGLLSSSSGGGGGFISYRGGGSVSTIYPPPSPSSTMNMLASADKPRASTPSGGTGGDGKSQNTGKGGGGKNKGKNLLGRRGSSGNVNSASSNVSGGNTQFSSHVSGSLGREGNLHGGDSYGSSALSGRGNTHGNTHGSMHASTHGNTQGNTQGNTHTSTHGNTHAGTHSNVHGSVYSSGYVNTHGSSHGNNHASSYANTHSGSHTHAHTNAHPHGNLRGKPHSNSQHENSYTIASAPCTHVNSRYEIPPEVNIRNNPPDGVNVNHPRSSGANVVGTHTSFIPSSNSIASDGAIQHTSSTTLTGVTNSPMALAQSGNSPLNFSHTVAHAQQPFFSPSKDISSPPPLVVVSAGGGAGHGGVLQTGVSPQGGIGADCVGQGSVLVDQPPNSSTQQAARYVGNRDFTSSNALVAASSAAASSMAFSRAALGGVTWSSTHTPALLGGGAHSAATGQYYSAVSTVNHGNDEANGRKSGLLSPGYLYRPLNEGCSASEAVMGGFEGFDSRPFPHDICGEQHIDLGTNFMRWGYQNMYSMSTLSGEPIETIPVYPICHSYKTFGNNGGFPSSEEGFTRRNRRDVIYYEE